MKLSIVLPAAILATPAMCFADEGEVEVMQVGVISDAFPATDLFIRVNALGTGDFAAGGLGLLRAREIDFGAEGIARIQALLTASLLSGKTVFLRVDDTDAFRVRAVFLEATR